MSEWTQAATDIFNDYLEQTRTSLEGSDSDVGEVIEDMKRHVEEDVKSMGLSIVSESDIKLILAKLGPLESQPVDNNQQPPNMKTIKKAAKKLPGIFFFIFGIILPCITIIVELTSRMCASGIFDPIPSPGHALLLFSVPLSNLLIFIHLKTKRSFPVKYLGLLNGLAIGTSCYYTLLFLPLLPIGLIAIIFIGLGFLPLTPVISLICTLISRRSLKKSRADKSKNAPGLWGGLLIAALLLVAFEIPATLTKAGMKMAISESETTRLRGIRLLRTIGDDDLMLRMCYVRSGRSTDMISFLFSMGNPVQPDDARPIFYRVTGAPYTSLPRPELSGFRRGYDFDAGVGGSSIGSILSGLSLTSSKMDASVDPDAALSYLEWTLEFTNKSYRQREARAIVTLPPDGVVSRLTLWVNGEEQEAAFAARGKVTEAYKKIVRQRLDPVLITTRGDDRILVQCFPVPPKGTMKIRFGITAPLHLENKSTGIMPLPVFSDRNFNIENQLKHAIWVESESLVKSSKSNMKTENPTNGLYACRGEISDSELIEERSFITVSRTPDIKESWTPDPLEPEKRLIHQTIRKTTSVAPSKVVFVIDGSVGMERVIDTVSRTLGSMPFKISYSIIVASDKVLTLTPDFQAASPGNISASVDILRRNKFKGGCDNIPALIQAWEKCTPFSDSAVVWIHSSIPELISKPDSLKQRFDRRPGGPVFYDIQISNGPNRIAEAIENPRIFKSVNVTWKPEYDLKHLFNLWSDTGSWTFERKSLSATALKTDNIDKTSTHLARLWANEKIKELLSSDRKDSITNALQLASSYQLVTEVSGAVVLETKKQFDDAGLTPADRDNVPTIPEPETWMMIMFVLFLLTLVYFKQRSAKVR